MRAILPKILGGVGGCSATLALRCYYTRHFFLWLAKQIWVKYWEIFQVPAFCKSTDLSSRVACNGIILQTIGVLEGEISLVIYITRETPTTTLHNTSHARNWMVTFERLFVLVMLKNVGTICTLLWKQIHWHKCLRTNLYHRT